MRIVPKASVRTNLTLTILFTIILSWIIGGGIANYFNYVNFYSFRKEMLRHNDSYSMRIPKPKFGIREFITGRPPFPRGKFRHDSPLQVDNGPMSPKILDPKQAPNKPVRPQPIPPNMQAPDEDNGAKRGDDFSSWFELKGLLLRLAVALGMAAIAGAWLGRRFTNPLTHLAQGAHAFHSGNFKYRIPTSGENEFSAVAISMNEMAQQVSDHISNLENDAERRRKFLADIAHELRSPVTTMRTMAGALQDGVANDPERKERAVSALVRTSERLQRLVQELMELAKLDLNELPLNLRHTDICELIESVIQSFDDDAKSAKITIQPFSAQKEIKTMVDPDRITQVLDNIVGNAISYAGENSEVKFDIDDNENMVKIIVSDTGKGISEEDLPYVFDSFYRADTARTPGDCHSGLGLSIARKLVEAHGGNLTVSSKIGEGTSVSIVLPKAMA